MLVRAWYRWKGKLRPARGKHGSIAMRPEVLDQARKSAKAHGHPLVREQAVEATPGERIVAAARKHLGQHENGASNRGPQVNAWLLRVGMAPGNPWCAAFACCMVADALGDVAHAFPRGGSASCWKLRTDAQQLGRWSTTPRVGYIGIMPRDEHAFIVTEVDGATVSTIAGNTSASDGTNYNGGEVAEHPYRRTDVAGYVRTY